MKVNFIVALNNLEIYSKYLAPSIIEVIRSNKNPKVEIKFYLIEEGNSIFEKYNKGIELSDVKDEDICIFIHEDVKIINPSSFIFNILRPFKIFTADSKIGVLGIAGTRSFSSEGGWWLNPWMETHGHWYQGHPDGKVTYNKRAWVGFNSKLVSVDGCCMIVPGYVLKNIKFDADTYPNAYHFYDVDFCFSCLESGYKVAVSNILIEHASEGPLSNDWTKNREVFLHKWISNKGYRFPITRDSLKTVLDNQV